MEETGHGGCACGQARFVTRGAPKRAGLCHCLTCRKAHASAFNPFLVFDRDRVEVSGVLRSWESSAGYDRRFCATCGARVIAFNGSEVELSLGSFDEAGLFTPAYESWVTRREPWLAPLPVPQHCGNRGAAEA